MAKITKGEHGLLADGKPIDESSFAELSDEDLEQTSGGITVIQHFDGSSVDKLRCWQCGGEDWDLIGWRADNKLWARCKKCGWEDFAEFY